MPPFGPFPRVYYVVGALAACLLLSNGLLAWKVRHASERVRVLHDTIRVVEVEYRTDTIRLGAKKGALTATRDTLQQHKTDTLLVDRFITAVDSFVAACDTVVETGERRVALRDTLVREIVKAVSPKPLQLYGEALTGYQWQAPELRAGASLRVTPRVHVMGELAHRLDDGRTIGRVGVRLTY